MNSTIIDLVVLGVILLSALFASARGLTREVLALGGWVIAALAGYFFGPMLQPYIQNINLPVVGSLQNCAISLLLSFLAVMMIFRLLIVIISPSISGAVGRSRVGFLDRFLGFMFGALRGFILVGIVYIIYVSLTPGAENTEPIVSAQTRSLLEGAREMVFGINRDDLYGWFNDQMAQYMQGCTAETPQNTGAVTQ